ncbi:MAG: DNA repair protein RecO [Nevskia sp.]|nr:DNA repair protein RecO [Nevskia sp.]
MRQRVEFEPAYLLTQRSYRETSRLLETFTRGHGRVGLVARGASAARSKVRGVLQPFSPLLLSWTESGELGTLTAVESAGPAVALTGERVFHGWYLNELLLRLTERHDPHPALFDDYAVALAELPGTGGEAALRVFEKRLLAHLGYALPLSAEVDPQERYGFDPEQGPHPLSAGAAGYAGASLIALQRERLDTREALLDARKLLQAALRRHLGGRELETPRLLRSMRANIPVPAPSKKPDP